MATSHKHISYALTTAIYKALSTFVTVSGTTYPVYQGVPTDVANTYVRIGEVIDRDNGTKEDFMYEGSVTIIVNDESGVNQFDKKLVYSIQDKVRSLLKTSKSSTLTVTGFTMPVFSFDTSTELLSTNDSDRPQIQLIDIYRFIIE